MYLGALLLLLLQADRLQAERSGQQLHAVAPRPHSQGLDVPAAGGEEEPQGPRRDDRRLQPPAGARHGPGEHHQRRRRDGQCLLLCDNSHGVFLLRIDRNLICEQCAGAAAAGGADEAGLRYRAGGRFQKVHEGEAN